MLKSIEIEGYRGIREGRIDDLSRLNIIIGPNGTGKSTVLEALQLLASGCSTDDPTGKNRESLISERRNEMDPMTTRIWAGLPAKKFSVTGSFGTQSARITHELGGRVWGRIFTPRPLPVELRHFLQQMMYVDAQRALGNNLEKGLWQTFYLSGRRREMLDRFGETFDMKVKEASYSPQGGILIDTEPYPLRLDDLGGGMRIAFRLLMAETIASGSALLLEEFDAYQYRTSLEKLVDALNDVAHALDVQIFLTTHSLETVYAFLESSKSADPDAVRVITLSRSSDGKLESHSLHSADASNLLAAGLDLRYSPTPSR